ncbi:hypothetical protein [Micromonospora andamanensis]|uniref:hypothetical protein n=1 Tax=Micromonospora andamanensis TaxID=1287068 RepID=UPI001951F8D8|nr:hypothetical protein [Micromonospora andamanensis]GIJ39491.1 hypothetical protein Vwe01_28160 [Micromonospora andamanensis]
MAVTFWLVKIEYERTPSIIAALRAVASKLKLSVMELERESRERVLVTRRYRCTNSELDIFAGWSLASEISERVGPGCHPKAVIMHPELEPEPIPPVMCLAEIGVALGVSRQRAQQLSRQPEFPRPIAKTSHGPIYAVSDIVQYHQNRERKRGKDLKGDVIFPKITNIR